jgi:hypothetical protein
VAEGVAVGLGLGLGTKNPRLDEFPADVLVFGILEELNSQEVGDVETYLFTVTITNNASTALNVIISGAPMAPSSSPKKDVPSLIPDGAKAPEPVFPVAPSPLINSQKVPTTSNQPEKPILSPENEKSDDEDNADLEIGDDTERSNSNGVGPGVRGGDGHNGKLISHTIVKSETVPKVPKPDTTEEQGNVLAYFVFFLFSCVALAIFWRRRQRVCCIRHLMD